MEFLTENWGWLVSLILTALTMVLGTKWVEVKNKLKSAVKEGSEVIIESIDLTQKLLVALEDDKISPEEQVMVKKEAGEVVKEWKEFLAVWKKDPKLPVDPVIPE